MEISTEERLSDLLRLSRDAYAAAECPERWPQFLGDLAERFDSGAAAIVAMDQRSQHHLYSVAGGVTEEEWAAYVNDILPLDPRLAVLRAQPDLACVHDADAASPAEDQAPAYRHWLERHRRWRSVAGTCLHQDEDRSICAVLLRENPRSPVSEAALRDFRHLAPTLRHATLMSEDLLAHSTTRSAIDITLDYLPTAVLVLDAHANVLYRNAAAHRLVRNCASLHVQDGRLRLARHGDQRSLYTKVREVLEHGHVERRRRMIRFSNGRTTLTALAAPLPPPARAFCRGTAAALVMIWSAELSDMCRSSLRETFGLTRREAELAAHIAQGYSLNGAAERMGIKRSTVRVHLENILTKTGTHRQTELVALLRSSSATTPPALAERRRG